MSYPTWDQVKARFPEKDQEKDQEKDYQNPKTWLDLKTAKKEIKLTDPCLCWVARHFHKVEECPSNPKLHPKNLIALQAELSSAPPPAFVPLNIAVNKTPVPKGKANPASASSAKRAKDYSVQTETVNKLVNEPLQYAHLGKQIGDQVLTKDPYQALKNPDQSLLPTTDAPTSVITNYLAITGWPKRIYEYSISFKALVQSKGDKVVRKVEHIRDKERVFKAPNVVDFFSDIHYATDFTTIWTLAELKAEQIDQFVFKKQNGASATIRGISFELVKTHQLGGGGEEWILSTEFQHELRALNALVMNKISRGTGDNVKQLGANKFFFTEGWNYLRRPEDLQPAAFPGASDVGDLLAIRGYFTSVRPAIGNQLLLSINAATSAFFQPILVSQFIRNYAGGDLAKEDEAKQLLTGVQVRITYLRPTRDGSFDPNHVDNRLRYITEFGLPLKEQLTCRDVGRDTKSPGQYRNYSVSDFYSQFDPDKSTQVTKLDQGLACVNVGARQGRDPTDEKASKATWYPQELLEIVPNQIVKRTLKEPHSALMITHAASRPHVVASRIVDEGLDLLGLSGKSGSQSLLADLNLHVGTKLLEIPASYLQPPPIIYRDDSRKTIKKASWNLTHSQDNGRLVTFKKTARLDRLFIIRVTRKNDKKLSDEECKSLYKELSATLNKHGLNLPQLSATHSKTFVQSRVRDLTTDDLRSTEQFDKTLPPEDITDSTMCLVVLPKYDAQLYGQVKRMMDNHAGYRSVCCVLNKVRSGKQTDTWNFSGYLSNIALKFNFKNYGVSHVFSEGKNSKGPLKQLHDDNGLADTIVLGSDVTHPSGNSVSGTPSVAAVVGTNDEEFMNFPGSMRLQAGRTEIIKDLNEMVQERLRAWRKKAGGGTRWPTKILFYRDGVGENQYDEVKRHEIVAIKNAYHRLTGQNAQLTFMVVGKRHHTRFFPSKPEDACAYDRSKPYATIHKDSDTNVRPGLIVDQAIVGSYLVNEWDQLSAEDHVPVEYEFYLQSHAAIKGTARSAHYVVLENEGNFTKGQIQSMTHLFCYAYARATKGVSYCAPAYYADRLCTRGKRYLEQMNTELNSTFPKDPKDPNDDAATLKQKHDDWLVAMAARMSVDPKWNLNKAFDDRKDRKNPWHPKMDDIMFYL
ncbi:hypothetical protein FKW77_002698 [Venturia effusa]|uniref:Piwi domain-containing protein n=1 Tax=Venturia effusa TaxID=50376 RepID=A0A517LMM3_9PEZI|nr:hypothetical protein FKW77_002698 [Venturia effusa]